MARSRALSKRAIVAAGEIAKMDSKAARWIASDALRELRSERCNASWPDGGTGHPAICASKGKL